MFPPPCGAVQEVSACHQGNHRQAGPVCQVVVSGQVAYDKAQDDDKNGYGDQGAHGGGGHHLGQADGKIIDQNRRDAESRGHALIFRQRGNKHAHGQQRRAQQEEGKHGAVGGRQVHLAKPGENQRIQRDQCQRDQIYGEQSQIFPQNHLGGGNGQRVQKLVGLLLPFLRDDAHGQYGDDDGKYQGAEAQHKFKVAYRRLNVVHHRADAHSYQQESPEHIGSQGVEIDFQFMLEYGGHWLSSFSSFVSAALSGAASVNSRKMSSRFAFFRDISSIGAFASAKAKKMPRETS